MFNPFRYVIDLFKKPNEIARLRKELNDLKESIPTDVSAIDKRLTMWQDDLNKLKVRTGLATAIEQRDIPQMERENPETKLVTFGFLKRYVSGMSSGNKAPARSQRVTGNMLKSSPTERERRSGKL